MNTPEGSEILIKANKISFAYNDTGGNDTIPLLFIHAFPLNKSMWEFQEKQLSKNNRVMTVDLRGFGKSESDGNELSMSLFADDVIALMDALELQQAIACGISMGGYILLNALTRYPERFAALILSDTQCEADTEEAAKKRYDSIEEIRKTGVEPYAETFIVRALHSKAPSLQKRIKDMILSTPVDSICNALEALAKRWETCSELRQFELPVLIIHGRDDQIIPVQKAELLHKSLRNASLKIIDNSGHFPNIEQPDEFNEAVNSFVAGISDQ
jgi:3-oxoadipate enol-lactonase